MGVTFQTHTTQFTVIFVIYILVIPGLHTFFVMLADIFLIECSLNSPKDFYIIASAFLLRVF